MSKCEWKEISKILKIPEDTKDSDIEKYLSENENIRNFLLYNVYETCKNNIEVESSIMSFIKKIPEKFDARFLKDINPTPETTYYLEVNNINSGLDFITDKEYIQLYNNDSYYPDYIFNNNKNMYLKTRGMMKNREGKDCCIYRKMNNNNILNTSNLVPWNMYSLGESCPYCVKAEKLLDSKLGKDNYRKIMVNSNNKDRIWEETDIYTNGYHKFPMVFYYDKYMGGYDDLRNKL